MFERGRCLLTWRLWQLAWAFGATSALAGPGGSGGNPSIMIASPAKNYLFFAVAPTGQTFSSARDDFAFGLAGFTLAVAPLPYDPSRCAAANGFKTVCAAHGSTEATVVFGDHTTFRLRFKDTGIGAARLEQAAAGVVATFSQGAAVQRKTSTKE